MKLYSINCYGVSTTLGVNEEEAKKAYLHRHPELIEVEEIEDKLEVKQLLNDEMFEELFTMLQDNSENGDSRDESMFKAIDFFTWSKSFPSFTCQQKFDILTLLQWMQEGMTIYGDELEFNELIANKKPLAELE